MAAIAPAPAPLSPAAFRPRRPPAIRGRAALVPDAAGIRRRARAAIRCAIFLLLMIPARWQPVNWLTRRPIVRRLTIPTARGPAEVELYQPPGRRRRPGIVASFGINPTGAMDPRVAQMGNAFGRAGFVTLLYWPPTARDLEIEPADEDELVAAFETLVDQPGVDPRQVGFVGICVGGALGVIAAADQRIRDRVAFVAAYAPYSSFRTLAVDIAGGVRTLGGTREPWTVDPLTWQVYVRTVTGWLAPEEAARLRDAFEGRIRWNPTKTEIRHAPVGPIDPDELSANGRAALRLLKAGADDVEAALDALPPAAQRLLSHLSPLTWVGDLGAPRIVILHDRDDHVIPVGESRRLWAAISDRPGAVYTELGLRHLRMPASYSPGRVVKELWRSYVAWYPLFLGAPAPASRRRRS